MREQLDPRFLTIYQKLVIFILPVVFTLLVSEVSNASNKNSKETEPLDCLEYGLCLREIVAEREKEFRQPQENFYDFVCLYNKNVTNSTQLLDLETFRKTQLIRMYKKNITRGDHKLMKVAKNLFQSCIEEELKTVSLSTIKKIIEEIGGWPAILSKQEWNEIKFDWKKAILKLRDMGVPPSILKLSVVPKHRTSMKWFSRVESRYQVSIVTNNIMDKSYIMITLANLFDPKSDKQVEDDYRDILPLWNSLRELEQSPIVEYTIRDYINLTAPFNWIPILNGLMGTPAYFVDQFVLNFPPTNTTIQFLKIMNDTPPRILANYIIWSIVYELSPFLDAEVRDVAVKPYESREEFCLDETEKRFEISPAQFEADNSYFTDKQRENVSDFVYDTKNRIIIMLRNDSNLFGFPNNDALSQALLSIQVFVARATAYKIQYDRLYQEQGHEMEVTPYKGIKTFLTWILLANKNHDTYLLWEGMSPDMHFNLQYFKNYDITYYKDINTLYIPRVAVERFNYIQPESPDYLFTKAILRVKVMTALFNSLGSSTSAYKDATNCTWQRIIKYNNFTNNKWNPEEGESFLSMSQEITSLILAVRLAREIFFNELQELIDLSNSDKAKMLLGGFNFKPGELFWISVATSMCSYDTDLAIVNKMKLFISFGDHQDFIDEDQFHKSYSTNKNITMLRQLCHIFKDLYLFCIPHCKP